MNSPAISHCFARAKSRRGINWVSGFCPLSRLLQRAYSTTLMFVSFTAAKTVRGPVRVSHPLPLQLGLKRLVDFDTQRFAFLGGEAGLDILHALFGLGFVLKPHDQFPLQGFFPVG